MWRLLPALLAACGPAADSADPSEDYCDGGGSTELALMTTMVFGRQDDGVSVGFDLDGHVSDAGDDEGCGVADLVSPDGVAFYKGFDEEFVLD